MKITVTATSTDVKSLIETAWYNFNEIEKNRIKDRNNNNSFWVYIHNTCASSIFIENIFDVTTTNWEEIVAGWDFSLDIYELSKLNLIVASGTVEIKIIIT